MCCHGSWRSCQGIKSKHFPQAWFVDNNQGMNWQKVPFGKIFWSSYSSMSNGKDKKQLSLARENHKATHTSEPKTSLVRKVFQPVSCPANNDPDGWCEVRWNASYPYYLWNAGAGRKTHSTVIQQTEVTASVCTLYMLLFEIPQLEYFAIYILVRIQANIQKVKGCVKKPNPNIFKYPGI